MLVPATGGSPIAIDLHRIRQSDYTFRGNSTCRWWATFSGQAAGSAGPSRVTSEAFQLYLVTPWFLM